MAAETMVAGQPSSQQMTFYEYYHYQDLHVCPLPPQEYGPMTVPMVSTNSSPPIAMPVQVPHGHVVQQIVDESGTLRHVILSPQHPPPLLPIPQHFGAGNPSGSNQPQGFYPGTALPHGYPPYNTLQPGVLSHGPPQGHSPPPHSFHKDERSLRQYNKLKKKLEQKQLRDQPLNTTPPLSPRKELNGNSRKGVGSVGTSEDGEESSSLHDEEEDFTGLSDLLGNIKPPEVSEIGSRTALLQWSTPPQMENPRDLNYEVLLSDRGKEGKYKSIYSGEALSCRIEDLRPGTEYCVCVSARTDQAVGCPSLPAPFVTLPCEPDAPPVPKLANRTRNTITLKWLAAADNGSHIDHYIVEWDVNGTWSEIAKSKSKQALISKLQPATKYCFRVAAVNQFGKSNYSPIVWYQTCDSPPPQPAPPLLSQATPNSLSLYWTARPQDDEFTLQMEDPESRHGFLAVYNGRETSYICNGLRKNASYKFRLKSQNEDGCSRWSDETSFSTLPGKPGPPGKPQLKGKLHLHSLRLRWDPPNDKGGALITGYSVDLVKCHKDSSSVEVLRVYNGAALMCTVDGLEPGTVYEVRVSCQGPGGVSDFSEPTVIATEPICPGQCQPPRLHGKPKAHQIAIKWSAPATDGGSPLTEMEVGVRKTEEEGPLTTAYKGLDNECIVTDLSPHTAYSLTVRAVNRVGPGPWSLPLDVVSGAAAPGKPQPPVLAHVPQGVAVTWSSPKDNGSPLTQYVVQMATPPGDNYAQVYCGLAQQCEVKPVPPATLCLFRLQAANSIGSSEWSDVNSILTDAGVPGTVANLKANPTPNSISLSWSEPLNNGDPVTHYTIDSGDSLITATQTCCTIENLIPATTYRIRVRAVNNIGSGAVASVRITTLPLPPPPPQLTLNTAGHNYLKLRWGAPNSNTNNHIFTVTMTSSNSNRRSIVYEGTSTSCKVSRLQEQSSYNFTIMAANSTGKGPESEVFTFSTVIAPPLPVKGLKVSNVSNRSCHLDWVALRPQGNDSIEYSVQCARLREQTFKLVYHGSEHSCEIKDLDAGAEYLVRVCAIRQSPRGPIEGPYSSPALNFATPPVHHDAPPQQAVRMHHHQTGGRRPLSDQQWAGIILSGFIVLAVLCAMLIANTIWL